MFKITNVYQLFLIITIDKYLEPFRPVLLFCVAEDDVREVIEEASRTKASPLFLCFDTENCAAKDGSDTLFAASA